MKARAYAGTTYLVSASTIAGMPYASTGDPWKCMFARENLIEKFFPKKDIPMATVDDVLSNPTQEEVRAKDSEKKSVQQT